MSTSSEQAPKKSRRGSKPRRKPKDPNKPGRFSQISTLYKGAVKQNPQIPLWMALAFAVGFVPLLLIGMVSFVPGVPAAIDQPVGALPSLIYIWENASERAFHERTAAAILVLLLFMIVMNLAAIILRRRFERRW